MKFSHDEDKVWEKGIKFLIYWTSLQSRVFELGLGLRWMPIHFFPPPPPHTQPLISQDLVIMIGSVEYTDNLVDKSLSNSDTLEKGYEEVARNINIYRAY
jgi:hypothetical protein